MTQVFFKLENFAKASIAGILVSVFTPAAVKAENYSPLPKSVMIGNHRKAAVPFDIEDLKVKWQARISAIRSAGIIPIIDIESSFNPGKTNARKFAQAMDDSGLALTAFSPTIGAKKYRKKGKLWSDGARRAVNVDPWRYIPVTVSAIYPVWTDNSDEFLKRTTQKAQSDRYPMLAEFEFRHYPSKRQYTADKMERDVGIPLNSAIGHKLFAFAEQSGIPFQIHYEVEDALFPALEEMLTKYPKARVIWCHLGQVRYSTRAKKYGPQYIRSLIEKYPNLYFDLAFGGQNSVYPGSNELDSTVWSRKKGKVKAEWIKLINDYPWRFLAALDLGPDRMSNVAKKVRNLRRFMGNLSAETREIVAYKAAWKLLFDGRL